MKKVTYRKTLDVQKKGIQFTVNAVKNEALSRQIILNIVDGGKPFDFDSDNLHALLYAVKPDGNILYNNCVRNGNTLIYTFTEQTLSVAGDVIARIKIIAVDNEMQVLFAPEFVIYVDDVDELDSAIESTNEYSALTTATANALSATSAANIAASNADEAVATANAVKDQLLLDKENGLFDGEDGNDYILTNTDKQDIANIVKKLIPQKELIKTITLTEECVEILIDKDENGNAFDLNYAEIVFDVPSGNRVNCEVFLNNFDELTAKSISLQYLIQSYAQKRFLKIQSFPNVTFSQYLSSTVRCDDFEESNISALKFILSSANNYFPIGTKIDFYGVRNYE